MVEFTRIISKSEINAAYLNLTDEQGHKHGQAFQYPHRARLAVVDGDNRVTTAKKHHGNQIWGLNRWYADNSIQAGTRVRVRHDPSEKKDGLPALHLIPVGAIPGPPGPVDLGPTGEGREAQPEIPLSLERQLEDYLAANTAMLEPGLELYRDEDGREGKQYPTDVGVIDLLCRRPDGGLLVVELKRGRTSDVTVGQLSRYMGWVKKNVSAGRPVTGLILAHERDENLTYAVAANPSISLRYFKLRLQIISEDELE